MWAILSGIALTIAWLLYLFMAVRHSVSVDAYWDKLGDRVQAAVSDDIRNHREWQWRYDELISLLDRNYEPMCWQWWRKPESFIKDLRFAEAGKTLACIEAEDIIGAR